MSLRYCIWALLLLAAGPAAAQQAPPPQPAEGDAGYTIFVRGEPIGREDVTVQRTTAGVTTIISRTRIGPPVNLVTRRAEVRYRADGSPESVYIDAQLNGADVNLETTFENGVATTKGHEGNTTISESHPVSPQTIRASEPVVRSLRSGRPPTRQRPARRRASRLHRAAGGDTHPREERHNPAYADRGNHVRRRRTISCLPIRKGISRLRLPSTSAEAW